MPKNLKFASERRSNQRKKVIQAEMLQAQTFIQMHLCFIMAGYYLKQHDPLIPVQTIQSIYPDLEIKTRSEGFT